MAKTVAMGKTFKAYHRNARISPYKARPVIDMIRGKPADVALQIMEYEPRRAAGYLALHFQAWQRRWRYSRQPAHRRRA